MYVCMYVGPMYVCMYVFRVGTKNMKFANIDVRNNFRQTEVYVLSAHDCDVLPMHTSNVMT